MAKVFGIHEIEIRPDVTADAFEQFARDVLTKSVAGCTIRILKGDRGARADKYLLLMEFDHVETRDRWFPVAGGDAGPEAEQYMKQMMERWSTFVASTPGAPGTWTDYVEITS
jgi:hypothetical protein